MIQTALIAEILVLLAVANGSPIAAKRLLGDRFAYPLDAGRLFTDGRPIFGRSKTVRGIAVSVVSTSLVSALLGEPLAFGALVSLASMTGDLLSSFVKRRLGLAPSSQATGLDQIPESLLPALACYFHVGLTLPGVAVVVAAFLVGAIVLSNLLYRIGFRDRPH